MQAWNDLNIQQHKQHKNNIQEKSSSSVAFGKLEGLKQNIPVHRTETFWECSNKI